MLLKVLLCAFFCGLPFFDGLECFLCFFSKVGAFFFHKAMGVLFVGLHFIFKNFKVW